MALSRELQTLLRKALEADGSARLLDDAKRLSERARRLADLLHINEPDLDAIELACHAMQLPLRHAAAQAAGRPGRTNLRERTSQAAELLVGLATAKSDDLLIDRATRLLHEAPHRSPVIDDARLLADAINLGDFGLTGLVEQILQASRSGGGVALVIDGCEKREQYGYWEARLKDGFHFDAVRKLATRRLARARQVVQMLSDELKEDQK